MSKMQTCEKCGKNFQGRTGAKYCSPTCRQAAYRQRKDPRPPTRRVPLKPRLEQAWLDLSKSVFRIDRLSKDDRYAKLLKDDPHFLRGDLQRSIDELQAIVDEIDNIRTGKTQNAPNLQTTGGGKQQ